ncbi:MAG TPA: polyphenol oxidase family protein [Solirubrobacteraceae bacterium]|nr:polyphenol oxidase family protein [Solirubrobacteraceae bacterium]
MSASSVVEHAEGFSCELGPRARALFTSRAHGNLSTSSGERSEHGRSARDRLCERLGLRWLCASRQVHGSDVLRIDTAERRGGEPLPLNADGHATAAAGIGAMVLAADCLPVALAGGRGVAMLHAGWRGLAAGVLEQGVRALHDVGGGGGANVAAIGPSAGVCCYEVGPEVHAAFGVQDRDSRYRRGDNIDLRAIARDRLLSVGVTNVLDVEACTICDERFFSHRRQGERAGRQAGVAWLA